ncbi:MAG: hydroxyacid dehydrogenase [Alphaproteobacteria bacterium]|nr:hydroxyacid dehydrogenase [Alphaproteobacteria bacterium]
MSKVLIIQPFHQDGMALLEARDDVSYEIIDGGSIEEMTEKITNADGVTIRTALLPGEVLERAERLKVVSRHGVGYDNVDLDVLNRRGIPLALTVDANATSVAEHVLFMMLHLAKLGARYDRATRDGEWAVRNSLETVDIGGRRILIIGFGRIGKEVAKLYQAFRMQVAVYDPYVPADIVQAAGCQPVGDFRENLGETDVVTVHMPLTETTRHMIGEPELRALPSHALVINCARGGIVDEHALHAALTSGGIAGAGLDVYEQEPPPGDHPLFALDNVILSPHSAGLTMECAKRMAVSTARSVLAGIDGNLDPAMVVNKEVL